MEANGFKRRIIEAYKTKQFLKIIFQYPSSNRAIIKRGIVLEVYKDCFDLEEIIDGKVTYSFNYIVEIKGEGK